MGKIKVINFIKKAITVYLILSLVVSITIGFVYHHFEVFVLSYIFFSLFILIGIKRLLIVIPMLLLVILFFLHDIFKCRNNKMTEIISITLLFLKILCIFFTMDVWVELTDIFGIIN